MLDQILHQQSAAITALANKVDLLQAAIGILKIRCDANEGIITPDEAVQKIDELTRATEKPKKPKSKIVRV